jgi:beta-N-acetylhexosaminidase
VRFPTALSLIVLALTPSLSLAGATVPPSPARASLADLPLEVKVGQMLMAGVQGTALTDDARRMIGELHLGNVVLMGPNVVSPEQVLGLTRELQALALEANGIGLLIATDQEGGRVQRLRDGFTRLPDAVTVGAARRPDLARAYGRMVGEELLAVGVNMDLAPVLDVNDNPLNPVIGPRSFGSSPEAVESAAPAFLAGLHDAGVAATGKHFPGHGNTSTDSHLTLPFVLKDGEALRAVELRPFRAAVAAGIDAIMPAHVVYPALDPSGLPATVSAPIVTGVLRGELGFRGLVVTDDMGMQGITELYSPEESAVRAVLAGADVVLCARLDLAQACKPDMLAQLRAGLLQAVADGRLPMARVDESVARVQELKARYQVGPASGDGFARIGGAAHLRLVADILEAAGKP